MQQQLYIRMYLEINNGRCFEQIMKYSPDLKGFIEVELPLGSLDIYCSARKSPAYKFCGENTTPFFFTHSTVVIYSQQVAFCLMRRRNIED